LTMQNGMARIPRRDSPLELSRYVERKSAMSKTVNEGDSAARVSERGLSYISNVAAENEVAHFAKPAREAWDALKAATRAREDRTHDLTQAVGVVRAAQNRVNRELATFATKFA